MLNWKTTAAGVASILTGLTGIIHAVSPDVPGPDLSSSVTAIIAGVGLLFAKDAQVTKS